MTRIEHRRISLLGLLGLALFLLKDVLFFGGAFYQRDLLSIYGPSMEAFVRAVAEGALPLRDPTSAFGQPLLGNPDAQIAYPLNWLNLILLPERAYPWICLFHFLLAAGGAAALSRRLCQSTAAGFLAGAFFMVSGPLQSFLGVWHHFAGAAWMPWVLLAADRLMERTDRPRTAALGTLFGLQILAGSADMCAMTLALVLLLFLCHARSRGGTESLRTVGAALVALGLAAGLGAATWMSVAEISKTSLRASLPEDVRTYWSIHPALIAEMVVPLNLGTWNLAPAVKDVLFEGREPFVASLFLGPVVLPLFLGALFERRLAAPYRWFGGIAVAVALAGALGRYTPFYSFLVDLLPPLRIFRFPSKLIIPVALLTSVLAGAALSGLGEGGRRVAKIAAVTLAAAHLALLPSVSSLMAALLQDPSLLALVSSTLTRDLVLSSICLLGLRLALNDAGNRALMVSALLAVFVALLTNGRLNPAIARSALRFLPETVDAVKSPAPSRVYVVDYVHAPERSRRWLGRDSPFLEMNLDDLPQSVAFVVAARAMLLPPIGGAFGVEYAWDMDLRGLYQGPLRELTEEISELEGTRAFLRLLQIGNVSHVLALHGSSFGDLRLERVVRGLPLPEPLLVLGAPDPLPRAYAVNGVRALDAARPALALLDPTFDPRVEVMLENEVSRESTASFRSRVEIVERRSDGATLDAWLNEPGKVVLIDGFLPGWTATLDGAAVPVHRANALFLAVDAPAGAHTIVFRYRPRGALLGIGLSSFVALLLLVFLISRRRTEVTNAVSEGSTDEAGGEPSSASQAPPL